MNHEEVEKLLSDRFAREKSVAMPNTMDRHNLKIRRRNVNEDASPSRAKEIFEGPERRSNGRVPRVPFAPDAEISERDPNGATADDPDEDGDSDLEDREAGESRRAKLAAVQRLLDAEDVKTDDLRSLGRDVHGFVNDETRRELWPRLLGIDDESDGPEMYEELDNVQTRVSEKVHHQILNDVARSGGHLRPNPTENELKIFQEEMVQLMCWVLHKHSRLNYYQGYNDIAATILIVMGLKRSLRILERISLDFLERFMERTMEKVNQELFYIFALLHRVHPTLLQHLENVELFPHFALAEYTTWYAHKYAENRELLHRLFDFFLGSPPLMPLYLSTVIVAHRDTEIFNTTPDMGHTHKVLCTLPDDLPFEKLLIEATELYREFPPDSISNDVRDFDHKRRCKEQEWKANAESMRKESERLRRLKVAIPRKSMIPYSRLRSYRTITVVTILAIGIYAFLKTGTGLN